MHGAISIFKTIVPSGGERGEIYEENFLRTGLRVQF